MFSGFPPSTKMNISKFQFDWEAIDKSNSVDMPLCNSHLFHFIYSIFIYFLGIDILGQTHLVH